MTNPNVSQLLRPARDVGLVGYGAYVPRYRLPATEVARVWTEGAGGLAHQRKGRPGPGRRRGHHVDRGRPQRGGPRPASTPPRSARSGSAARATPTPSSPPSTIVAEAIGAVPITQAADWQFACKAGTEAMQAAIGLVGSGMGDYALAIGMDTAQGRPGDALEYTAGAGGAAFLLGPAEEIAGRVRRLVLLRHRHARLLAPPVREVPRAWPALHRRAGLLQAHHRRGARSCWSSPTPSRRISLRGLASAQRQVPPARRQAAGLHRRPDQDRPAGRRHRQHLRRQRHDRPDRRARRSPARRPHPAGLLRLRRRLRRLRPARHRRASPSARVVPPRPRTTSPAAPRSTTPPMPVCAASW